MARVAGLDTAAFLPGPERLLPHLQDRSWQRSIDREERHMVGSKLAHRSTRTNPITWETPLQSARSSAISGRSSQGADVMSLEQPSRLGTASTHLSSRYSGRSASQYSARSGSQRGCGKSSRLHTAGSHVSAGSGRLSSILSAELDAERQQREAAEKEVLELREKLEQVKKVSLAPSVGSTQLSKSPGAGSQVLPPRAPGYKDAPNLVRIQTPAASVMTGSVA